MFVTCHINFWPLSNFFGASLEVTRTISYILHEGVPALRALRPDFFFCLFFFSNDSDILNKYLILIINSLAIHSGVF